MESGVKHDAGKIQLGLISTRFLRGLGQVLTFGAKKYAAHNWRKGMVTSRYYDALQRHLLAWNDGEDLDPESQLPHLYHAACCLMFLAETLEIRPDLDDRYKPDARNPVSPKSGDSAPEDPEKHGHISSSASGDLGDPRFPVVHVEPLCGFGVEGKHRALISPPIV